MMKNLKSKMFVSSFLCGVLGLILASCSTTQHKNNSELILGTCSGFPPYEIMNKQGGVIGFDIDVAQKIAKKLGKKLAIKDLSFEALFMSLKQNKIDIIIAGLSITQARLAEIAMVHYHGKPMKSLPVLFWRKIPEGVVTIADLAHQPNKTVCAQVGTLQEEVISKYSYLDIKHLENIPDLILDIKHGKSIAAVVEPMVVTALQQQIPEIKTLDLTLKEDEQDMGHGIGINKDNKKLFESIDAIVQQLKNDGTIEKLEKQWFTGGINVNQ